jgi:hypothetical protein
MYKKVEDSCLEDVFQLQVKEFNKGNSNFLMMLYEKDACFASEPG